jgi:UDP-3-O-[3-hydroxymyristoyl] N-acetylglucosamine deacetylase
VTFVGLGAQSGKRCTIQVFPAEADTGLRFVRCDLPTAEGRLRAEWSMASDNVTGTHLRNRFGHHLGPVDHLLSAFSGLGIDNAEVFADGPELPVMDGSALPFATAFARVGVVPVNAERDLLLVRKPIRIEQADTWAEFLPDTTQRISLAIDSPCATVGTQTLSLCLAPSVYMRELAAARTFGFADSQARLCRIDDAEAMAVDLDGAAAKPGLAGLRFPDEYVRHKTLDIIGDLALAGHTVIGHLRTNRPGYGVVRDLVALAEQTHGALERVSATQLYDCGARGTCLLQMGLGEAEEDAARTVPLELGQDSRFARV